MSFNDASECRSRCACGLGGHALGGPADGPGRYLFGGSGSVRRIMGRSGLGVPGIACEEIQTAKALLEASGLGTASGVGRGARSRLLRAGPVCQLLCLDAGTLAMALSGLLESEAMPMPVRVANLGMCRGMQLPPDSRHWIVGIVE